jgi:CheY-like chemotaxis protein
MARLVLLVEDDPLISEAIRETLAEEGIQVEIAYNGREALERLRAGLAPRMILLDLMMPVMNGVEFRREQQRDPRLTGIPVVLLSGDVQVAAQAAALDIPRYLVKPVRLAALIGAVSDYCPANG